MKRSIKRFKSVVFVVRQTRVLVYFPFATSILRTAVLYSQCLSLPTNAMLGPGPYTTTLLVIARTSLRLGEEAAETIWRAVNMLSMCRNTCNFFNSLVIFRHYFTGNGKVSCILATIFDWFPNKRFKNKICVVVFFSYWTKHESPAGDQF